MSTQSWLEAFPEGTSPRSAALLVVAVLLPQAPPSTARNLLVPVAPPPGRAPGIAAGGPPHPRTAASARRRATVSCSRPGPRDCGGSTGCTARRGSGWRFPRGARSRAGGGRRPEAAGRPAGHRGRRGHDQRSDSSARPVLQERRRSLHEALRPVLPGLRSPRLWSTSGASSRWKPRTRGGSRAVRRTSSSPSSTAASRSTTTTCGGTSGRTPARSPATASTTMATGIVGRRPRRRFRRRQRRQPARRPRLPGWQSGHSDGWHVGLRSDRDVRDQLRRRSGGGRRRRQQTATGSPTSASPHGTMVAGIIGAMADNINPDTGQFERHGGRLLALHAHAGATHQRRGLGVRLRTPPRPSTTR